MAQCTAKSKRSGERCKRQAMKGRTVCAMHGGKTPRGLALPQTTHGKYSQDLPTRLLSRYEESLADEHKLALENEIAVVDARLRDLFVRVDTGEAGVVWRRLREAYEAFTAANKAGDQAGMASALNELSRLIGRGNADYAAWHEINDMLALRMRLVESERKRILEAQQFVAVNELMVYTAAVLDAIRQSVIRNITDEQQRRAVLADTATRIDKLLQHDSGGATR
jgi:hypothetical protein